MPLKKQGRMRLQLQRSSRQIAGQRGRSRGSCPSSTPKMLKMKLLMFSFSIRFPGETTSSSPSNRAIIFLDRRNAASCTSCRCLANCSSFSTRRSNPSVCTRWRVSWQSGQKWRSSISLRKSRCLAQTMRSSRWTLLNQQSSSSRYLQMDCPFQLTGTGLPPRVQVSSKQSSQLSLSARLLAIWISLSMRFTLLFTKAISSSPVGRLCNRYIIRYFSYCSSTARLLKNRNSRCRSSDWFLRMGNPLTQKRCWLRYSTGSCSIRKSCALKCSWISEFSKQTSQSSSWKYSWELRSKSQCFLPLLKNFCFMRYFPRERYSLTLNCSLRSSFMSSMLRWKKSFDIRMLYFYKVAIQAEQAGGRGWIIQQNYCMKKFSLISNDNIRKHLANTSPAKITHSFSKSRRFLEPNPECKEAYYGSTTSLSKRHSGIGFGSRSDFTKSTIVSPASPTYPAPSQFDKLGQTFSFRIGREKSPERDYLYHVRKARVPGPGTYENQFRTRMSISFTHRPKTIDVNKKKLSFLETPQPGHYESIPMTPSDGRPNLSKHRTVKLSVINRDTRFKPLKHTSPGPMLYETVDNFNKDSRYVLSQRRGEGTRPFGHERKFTNKYWRHWDGNQVPGPGRYEKPSDFGVYGDVNYYKTLSFKA